MENPNKMFEMSVGINSIEGPVGGGNWKKNTINTNELQINNIVNHIDFKFEPRTSHVAKKNKFGNLDEAIELNPNPKKSGRMEQNRGAVFKSGNVQKQKVDQGSTENKQNFGFKLKNKIDLFIQPNKQKQNYGLGFIGDGNISGLGQSVSSTIKGHSIQLNKRNHQQFHSNYYNDKTIMNDTHSDYSLSKFNPQDTRFGQAKIANQNMHLSTQNEPKFNSHHSNNNKNKDYYKKNISFSGGLRLYKKQQSLIRKNRMTIELGLFFQASSEKEKYICKYIKEMKTNFLKLGIRIDKAAITQNNDKRILFDDSLGNNKFLSFNKSNCSKSMSILDGSDSFISAKIFDETFYNKYLLNNDSFNNILHNTFLHKLKNEESFDLFKKYLGTMEEMKTWMFQEFEEGKGYSNAEQFMKYFNLQVPINQHYFTGLSTKDKIKLICFFFCKFFNRNILMTQFGDVWQEIKIHHNYKTHSKM
jgi:hypothetical protein